jgi:alkylhydroperoxidase family enzyme
MSRLPALLPEQTDAPMRAVLEAFYAARGAVPNMFRTAAVRPEIAIACKQLMDAVINTGTLGVRLKELAIVRTSKVNCCVY